MDKTLWLTFWGHPVYSYNHNYYFTAYDNRHYYITETEKYVINKDFTSSRTRITNH